MFVPVYLYLYATGMRHQIKSHFWLTWTACALHARGGVHGVPEEGELGQLGAHEPRHAGPRVQPDADADHLVVVGHAHLFGDKHTR